MVIHYSPGYFNGWNYSKSLLEGLKMFIESLHKQSQDMISLAQVNHNYNSCQTSITFFTHYRRVDGVSIAHTVLIEGSLYKSAECIFQILKDSRLEEFLAENFCGEEGKKELAKIARRLDASQHAANQL